MQNKLKEILSAAQADLAVVQTAEELEQFKIRYFGKKSDLTNMGKAMRDLTPEERPVVGKLLSEVRGTIENAMAERQAEFKALAEQKALAEERIDVTMPGTKPVRGAVHPLTATINEMKAIFTGLGYEVVDGPEVETTYYNFDALNTPEFHPAKEMTDTFYISDSIILRTQTSPMQVRTMEKREAPLKIISVGSVYRPDALDATHSPLFHQMEGLCVGKDISFGDLKGTLINFCRDMFGQDRKVRFRPHNFPFTEPSAEVDVSCAACGGKGCRICGNTGWIEVLGAGMVHPNVLTMAGYDANELTGFAFGIGVERMCMLKYGVSDIRNFYENDIRFIGQFR